MRRVVVFVCAMLLLGGISYAEDVKYISPNDDGVQDTLSFPLKITDNRYVASWNLVVMDKGGQVVRTIGNKESLEGKITFKNIIKHIKDSKKDAAVPVEVVWNGRLDSGETAPDGEYTYYITATDDKGNTSKTKEYTVVVDNTPPEADVKQLPDRVFGAGEKAVLLIEQQTSSEDKWTATIKDDAGRVVRRYEWAGKADNIEWNGTDERGLPVADGIYSYAIEATDRAGNRSPRAGLGNIVFSADKSMASISIRGDRYFSPGTDSKKQTVSFDVVIPVPAAKSANRLSEWSVFITVEDGEKALRTWSGKDKPSSSIVYDGKDDAGNVLPDGRYRAMVRAKYLNGYESPIAISPTFVLDTTKPSAAVTVSDKIFGAGDKTAIKITPIVAAKPLAEVKQWTATIETADTHRTVREWTGIQWPGPITWDGDGEGVEDGEYVYRICGTDEAGNYGEAVSESFMLDTTTALIALKASREAFSPGGPTPTIDFVASVKAGAGGLSRYTLSVLDADGKAVYTKEGSGALPDRFTWDGTGSGAVCPDGEYSARIEIEGANTSKGDAQTMPFIIDTVPPYVKANLLVKAFAPGCEGAQKTAPVDVQESTQERLWSAEIKSVTGDNIVRHYTWSGHLADFVWDGSNESGNIAPDGDYRITIYSTDAAENTFVATLPLVTLDTRDIKGYITRAYEGISPNGDGYLDTQTADIALSVNDSIISWQADICDEKGQAVHTWKGGLADSANASVPQSLEWNGFVNSGKESIAGEGTFNYVLRVAYNTGRTLVVTSSPFVCTATPPKLSVAMTPKYFSPDNDGVDDDLFLSLGCISKARVKTWEFKADDPRGKVFWQTGGKREVTKTLTWDGLSNTQKNASGMAERVQSAVDYPYTYTVTDDLGMTSTMTGMIPVDVLVIRDGNVLKMAVPSIIFRADHADFKVETKPGKRDGITAEQAKNNDKVLLRVADILRKFKDYKVTVVGHANRTTENEAEETIDNPKLWGPALIPLSQQRAEAVMTYLTKHGVKNARLTTEGKGGTQGVVDWHDKDNNWKNRRVEFILHK